MIKVRACEQLRRAQLNEIVINKLFTNEVIIDEMHERVIYGLTNPGHSVEVSQLLYPRIGATHGLELEVVSTKNEVEYASNNLNR